MMQPIHILHTESSPNLGGQELRILLEMERLSVYGFRSWLVARNGSAILEEASRRGLQCISLPFHNRFDPISMVKLGRFLRREKIDLVNAHGSRDAWNVFPLARSLGIPTVRSRHVANPIRRHFLGQLVYGALCDRIVTTSASIRAGLIAAGIDGNKIVSIPTGIDISAFAAVERDGQLRRELGIPLDATLIGMISDLRGDKGPDLFLAACDQLLAQRTNVWGVLVGDGRMREQLLQQHASLNQRKRIVLAGFRRDISRILAELDLLAVPSRIPEGVPQVILQAHAARVPVIASRVAGVSEVAREGDTAFTVEAGDATALAIGLTRALNEPQRARFQAERGYALVVSEYSLDAMLQRMADLYRNLVGKK